MIRMIELCFSYAGRKVIKPPANQFSRAVSQYIVHSLRSSGMVLSVFLNSGVLCSDVVTLSTYWSGGHTAQLHAPHLRCTRDQYSTYMAPSPCKHRTTCHTTTSCCRQADDQTRLHERRVAHRHWFVWSASVASGITLAAVEWQWLTRTANRRHQSSDWKLWVGSGGQVLLSRWHCNPDNLVSMPRRQWSLLNRFRICQDQCIYVTLAKSHGNLPAMTCAHVVKAKMMSHIVNYCPLTKLDS